MTAKVNIKRLWTSITKIAGFNGNLYPFKNGAT